MQPEIPVLEPLTSPQHQHDPNQYYCSECLTKQPGLINQWGDQWICKKCLHQVHLQMQSYKLNRTQTYPQIDQILPNLYLGNEDAAINHQLLQTYQIGAIMACGVYLMTPHKDKYQYKVYNIMDDPFQKIEHLFDDSYQWIKSNHDSGKKVFIHCAAGVSRSASFVIAFLMKQKKLNFQDAQKFVKQRRRCILPNSGFIYQLSEYEYKLQQKSKVNQQYANK